MRDAYNNLQTFLADDVVRLNTGKIVSIVGDQLVVETNAADAHLMKTAYTSKGALGRVVDVIGKADRPYLVVKPSKNVKYSVGETVHAK